MALAPINVNMSAEDYLDAELCSDLKHEYDNGYIVGMIGASRAHNLIALTVASEIKQHLEGKPCRCYMSDMKVRIQTRGNDFFYYPDVMVSCDEHPPSEYYEDKPVMIVEVLSPTTETRDKLEKLAAYSSIATLTEYLTIAQDRVEIGRYTMHAGQTHLIQYSDGDTVELSSIGLSIPVKAIYADVAGKLFED
jgi:Uma2 family endonuclease